MLERTQWDWLGRVFNSSPVERRHNLMLQSADPETNKSVELSDKATDSTGAVWSRNLGWNTHEEKTKYLSTFEAVCQKVLKLDQ